MEAVIAVTVSELSESVVPDLGNARASLASLGFEVQLPRTKHDFQIRIEEGVSSFAGKDLPYGFQYFRSDRSFAVQFLRSGFVFSQLGSYTSWEDFTEAARKLWNVYLGIVGAVELVSFNVRYINKLFIPELRPWQDFIKIYPSIPEEVPQGFSELFMRITMPIEHPAGRLSHQQAILPPEREGFATVILDNDFQFSAIGNTMSGLWKGIDEVRDLKNDYFLKFLTPAMKEQFDA
jgi:uncharacterized protein (TIGR04255 family)